MENKMEPEEELRKLEEDVRAVQLQLAEERRKNRETEKILKVLQSMTLMVCREIHTVDWRRAKADFVLEYERTKYHEMMEALEKMQSPPEEPVTTNDLKHAVGELIEAEKSKVRQVEEKNKIITEKMKELYAYADSIECPEEREAFRKGTIEKFEKKIASMKKDDEEFEKIKAHAESINIDDLFK